MAQLSRPYQIGLAAVAVLALVWFVALRGHGGSSSEPPAPSAPSKPSASAATQSSGTSAAAQARAAAAPTRVYHGAAPGVEGLTRAIAKAHGAVATSQRNAAQLQRSSAQASDEASNRAGAGAGTPAAPRAAGARRGATGGRSAHTPSAHRNGGGRAGRAGAGSSSRPAQQAQVEKELTHGKTVVLVFWNSKSTVDATVRSQSLALARGSKGKVAVHVARASQVGLFGPVTEVAHVYQTPTVLIVSKHGLVTTLTGLTDVFALQQAVREAERANR